MKKVIKIRCYPNRTQKKIIQQTFDACRFVRNLYTEMEKAYYNETQKFLSGYDFAHSIVVLKNTEEKYSWLRGISTKAIKDAIMIREKAFKDFFKRGFGYPHFISKKKCTHESYFFIRDNVRFDITNQKIIKLPILGRIRISEPNRLPDISMVTSGRIIREYNKYYVMFIYEYEPMKKIHNEFGIGIDIGVKNYASIAFSNSDVGGIVENFIFDKYYKGKQERYNSLLRAISHKAEVNYWKLVMNWMDKHPGEEPSETTKNIMKGESYKSNRIQKLRQKANLAYRKLVDYRKNCVLHIVNYLVERINPKYITIEDLKVSTMLSNAKLSDEVTHNLHRYIQESSFYKFREHLINKCKEVGIELRIANKYFASSKICCKCGHKKKLLTLADRIYVCEKCGNEMDRDMNAAHNLVSLSEYKVIA